MKSMTLRCRLPISKNKLMEILAKHLIEPESTLNKLRGQTQANQGKTRDKSSIYKIIWLTNKFSKRTFYNRISRLTIFKISETSTTGTIMTIYKINQEAYLANKFCIRMKRQDNLVRSRMWYIMQAKIINWTLKLMMAIEVHRFWINLIMITKKLISCSLSFSNQWTLAII
jgi:hypothetical protein